MGKVFSNHLALPLQAWSIFSTSQEFIQISIIPNAKRVSSSCMVGRDVVIFCPSTAKLEVFGSVERHFCILQCSSINCNWNYREVKVSKTHFVFCNVKIYNSIEIKSFIGRRKKHFSGSFLLLLQHLLHHLV